MHRIIEAIIKLGKGSNLSEKESYDTIEDLRTANEVEVMLVLFLWGKKGYTTDELVGAAKALKDSSTPLVLPVELSGVTIADVCGAGGTKLV